MTPLSDILRTAKPKGGRVRIKHKHPAKVEAAYRKALRGAILQLAKEVKPLVQAEFSVNGQRRDSVGDLMRAIQGLVSRTLSGEAIARRVGEAVVAAEDGAISKAIGDALGIDFIMPGGTLDDAIDAWVLENTSLIKDLQEQYLTRVQSIVNNGFRQGVSYRSIADDINKQTGIGLRRAKLIARDQIGTLNSQVSEQRDRDLGIEEYIWRNSADIRVRGNPSGRYPNSKYNHWSREGKKYKWDNPPPDGHPGLPINCRCWAEAVISWD